jgi:hypothetical protein
MTRHWEPTTLKLTAKQARVLWHLLWKRIASEEAEPAHLRCRGCALSSMRAILRKLEETK